MAARNRVLRFKERGQARKPRNAVEIRRCIFLHIPSNEFDQHGLSIKSAKTETITQPSSDLIT